MTRRKRYSAEFKREALRRANEEGVTDVLVAEELGINARQLQHCLRAIRGDFVSHSRFIEPLFPATRGLRQH